MNPANIRVRWLCVVFGAVLLSTLSLSCVKVINGLPGGVTSWDYPAWGDQLQYKREDNFAWKDGSSWRDGISSTPPPIPVFLGTTPGTAMTCAQEEIIWMLAFPKDRNMAHWQSQPDADQIARQWQTNFIDFVWGLDYPQPDEPRTRESFGERCGMPAP